MNGRFLGDVFGSGVPIDSLPGDEFTISFEQGFVSDIRAPELTPVVDYVDVNQGNALQIASTVGSVVFIGAEGSDPKTEHRGMGYIVEKDGHYFVRLAWGADEDVSIGGLRIFVPRLLNNLDPQYYGRLGRTEDIPAGSYRSSGGFLDIPIPEGFDLGYYVGEEGEITPVEATQRPLQIGDLVTTMNWSIGWERWTMVNSGNSSYIADEWWADLLKLGLHQFRVVEIREDGLVVAVLERGDASTLLVDPILGITPNYEDKVIIGLPVFVTEQDGAKIRPEAVGTWVMHTVENIEGLSQHVLHFRPSRQ